MTRRAVRVRTLGLAAVALAIAAAAVSPRLAGAGPSPASARSAPSAPASPDPLTQASLARKHIKHVILIVSENHTFDSMFGTYPGANGLPINPDTGQPQGQLCDGTTIDLHRGPDQPSGVDHSFLAGIHAINGGQMNCFDKLGGGTVKGNHPGYAYYDRTSIPSYWAYADRYLLGDNYFSGEYGPTGPNILWSLADSSGRFVTHEETGQFGTNGIRREYCGDRSERAWAFKKMTVSERAQVYGIEDGPWEISTPKQMLSFWVEKWPCVKINTLPDELAAKGIRWRDYHGTNSFTQSIAMIRSIRLDKSKWSHVVSDGRIVTDIKNGKLPGVSWLTPSWSTSEHPPESMCVGENWLVGMVNAVMRSKYWNSTAIVVTYDEFGGFYDHVAPAHPDIYGFGPRLPLLIISPWTRRGSNPDGGYIDHTEYSLDSILRMIEVLKGIAPMHTNTRDGIADSMLGAFDFSQTPISAHLESAKRTCSGVQTHAPAPAGTS
ncbi:MAG: hypothetical protein M3P11_04585 [Actinomycetota bacterium]|nr:hypothetical protein [Actinomycetota bacterium]